MRQLLDGIGRKRWAANRKDDGLDEDRPSGEKKDQSKNEHGLKKMERR